MNVRLCSLLILLLGMVACSSLPPSSYMLEDHKEQRSPSGMVLSMKPGEVREISLRSNPTTGYMWFVENAGALKHVKVGDFRYVPMEEKGAPRCGASGSQVFDVEALSKGEDHIILVYKRSWEKKAPLETRMYSVEVR